MKKDIRLTLVSVSGNKQYNMYNEFSESRSRLYWGNSKTHYPAIGNSLRGSGHYTGSIPKCALANDAMMEILETITGTCPVDCDGCYAGKLTMYPSVFLAYLQNTIEIKKDPDRFWKMTADDIRKHYKKIMRKGGIVRIDDSGDLDSLENTIALRDNVIRVFPEIIFYGYSEYHFYADLLNLEPNAVIWKSRFQTIGSGNGYTYVDDGDPNMANLPHCPAIDAITRKSTGHKCNHCGMCANKELLLALSLCFWKHA